ncbi:MAG: hypothetical protein JWM57_623 [Phycisphaerales bacterium]|nr:hypothetical protein [Phycisphaerales bacterium]
MAKSYRDEAPEGNQKKLLVIFVVLLVIGLFVGFVWPGIWR